MWQNSYTYLATKQIYVYKDVITYVVRITNIARNDLMRNCSLLQCQWVSV